MPVKAKKLGRPLLPKGKVKGVITPIRLQPHEREQFEKAAKRAGVTLSEWMRETLKNAVKE